MPYWSKPGSKCSKCGAVPVLARHVCRRCYYQAYKTGAHLKLAKIPPTEGFVRRIQKTNKCWLWTGATNFYGYGVFLLPGEIPVRAHRFAFELWKRKLKKHEIVMHTCDNPPCVNPQHLRAGSRTDNNLDAIHKGRNAFGEKNGHAKLTAEEAEYIRSYSGPMNQTELARKFGIHQSHVSNMRRGLSRPKG